ncbi:O-antigen biosynthesis protein WlbH [Variovorax defluvii]|uniref:O-antigen biosynthesis protein WlbH n=1 Tax=Variovorax defluvii TaxID=913761 RepID=A0ABP8IHK7_9BURK
MAGAHSVHTVRWANGLASDGHEVHLISAHRLTGALDGGVAFHSLPIGAPWGYLAAAGSLRNLLRCIQPDILNAHYATGYGLLARLSRFQPLLLSMWGSDVYDFPEKSTFHRRLLASNLRQASALGSTSRCMARRAAETWPHPHIFVTPFGVDERVFLPSSRSAESGCLVIGTVKALKHKYGIDTLIEAFALALQQLKPRALRLEIAGSGPEEKSLKALAVRLGVAEMVLFHGPVEHERVPALLDRLNIFVALSRLDSESFGVAILEASAAGKAVVVSDADGPAEVTLNGSTGYVVPRNDPVAAADAIVRLARSPDLRERMGAADRQHVLTHYTWSRSLALMCEAYRETIRIHRRATATGESA